MAAKKAKGMSFADLEAALGLDEVWIASLFYGQATASKEEAEKLAELLSLDPAITAALQEFPTKGSLDPVIPTDPLIYRFYEIMQVYGMPLKDVIQTSSRPRAASRSAKLMPLAFLAAIKVAVTVS